MPYDAVRDFAPITLLATTPNVLVVNPSLPVNSVKELIAYAKANPGKLAFGSGSNGSAGHLAGELFKVETGTDIIHVPYKGAAPAMQALLAGDVQFMFDNLASATPQVKAGKLKALAVTTARRSPLAPDLPTMAEAGLPGLRHHDVVRPAGARRNAAGDRRQVERRGREGSSTRPTSRRRLAAQGAEAAPTTPESVRGVHQGRDSEVRADRQGFGREGRLTAQASAAQPPRSATPPNGVIAPSDRMPVSAST